jgi:hypothetical protein
LNFHKIKLEPKASFNIESQHLNSELRPLGETENILHPTPDSLRNNLDWLKSELNLAVQTSYHIANNAIYVNLPVSYKMLKLTNKIPGEKQSNDYLFFEPYIYTWFPITDKINLTGRYSFSNQLGNIQTLYPGYILKSYRNINAYNNKVSKAQTNGGELGLSYKDLIPAFFMRVSLSYHHTKNDVLYGQDFNGIMNTTYSIGKGNVSVDRSINGTISKGYDFWNIVFTLESMYGTYSSEQLSQNKLISFQNMGGTLSGNVSMKPAKWISLTYKGTLGENQGKIAEGERLPSIRTSVNTVNINLYLPKDLSLNLNYEQYYNSALQGNQYMSFTDLGVWYTWKKARISLDWSNIFDTKNYTTSFYNNISAYQYQYEIRPASILLKVKFKLR